MKVHFIRSVLTSDWYRYRLIFKAEISGLYRKWKYSLGTALYIVPQQLRLNVLLYCVAYCFFIFLVELLWKYKSISFVWETATEIWFMFVPVTSCLVRKCKNVSIKFKPKSRIITNWNKPDWKTSLSHDCSLPTFHPSFDTLLVFRAVHTNLSLVLWSGDGGEGGVGLFITTPQFYWQVFMRKQINPVKWRRDLRDRVNKETTSVQVFPPLPRMPF